jgi:muramoyltetrapeptide carboxypeptidase
MRADNERRFLSSSSRGALSIFFATLPAMLIRPRALPRNGRVVVLAISSPSELPRIEAAVRTLEERGLHVTLATNIGHRHRGYLAGDDDERLQQLNHYLRSDEVDAFFFARGGYGAMRILDGIDYDAITANPRPSIGFSDITALHQAVAVRCGVGSFH